MKVRITYCGVDGEGRTLAEARKDAAARLTRLVADVEDGPAIVRVGGWAKLVIRTRESWAEYWLAEDGRIASTTRASVFGHASRDEAVRSAATHCADLAWSHDVADDLSFARNALAPYVAKRDLDRTARDQAERWAWQRRYKAARDAGFDDQACRDLASNLRPIAALASQARAVANGSAAA
jgi:hypothetical protein